MDKKKQTLLSWDDFKALGNPDNVPDELEEVKPDLKSKMDLRVHYEKKGRGGKEACIIRGFEGTDDEMEILCKSIKTKIGVGGAVKDGEIIIQGNQRDRIMKTLEEMGYKKAKKAGG